MLMDSQSLLIALPALPLCAALLMALLPSKAVPRFVYEGIHLLSVTGVAVLGIYIVVRVMTSGQAVDALGLWLHLDALGSLFVSLVGVIGLLTGFYSLPYIRHDVQKGAMGPAQVKQYYLFFSLFMFTMLLVALSNNIIMMWVSIEATTLATVFLVGAYNTKLSLEAAWK